MRVMERLSEEVPFKMLAFVAQIRDFGYTRAETNHILSFVACGNARRCSTTPGARRINTESPRSCVFISHHHVDKCGQLPQLTLLAHRSELQLPKGRG
ncbi:hypothetical protein OE88DRAFT_1344005 [Heliocybe sulcata]|uniref:Uncharacterized protein n=1 Tax=Heliocybe sulcata TaxID=5364 RepID=A0A5C3N6U2_9AGAM|nr:hypothetical protein OE88DRAFT_1344005 [Heliocybe sulcata]